MSSSGEFLSNLQSRLERARRLQTEATASGQLTLFQDSAGEARLALSDLDDQEASGQLPPSEVAQGLALRRDLLHVLATTLLRCFDVGGRWLDLTEGLDLLRRAAAAANNQPDVKRHASITRDLIIALTRSGEQRDDIILLREAEHLLQHMAIDIEPGTTAVANYDLVNAAAVAGMRVGVLTGDRVKVVRACRSLSRFIKRKDVGGEARSQTTRNLVAALTANARQNRSERVYRQVLTVLDKAIDNSPTLDPYYLQYRGTARLELAGISGDEHLGRGAIKDLSQLVSSLREETAAAITATHSLAQAYFQVGKKLRAEGELRLAVRTIEQALVLAGNAEEDARVTRIIADVGAYRYAVGLVARDSSMIDAARKAYEEAVARSRRDAAPALFARVARGLFVLLFQQKDWAAALSAFSNIEEAWSMVIADPNVASEAYDQLAADLSGQYDRAAWCEIELGNFSRASERIESGRAQRLAQSRMLDTSAELPVAVLAELGRAKDALENARRRDDAEDVRHAWESYLSTRRRTGLDTKIAPLSAAQMHQAIGSGGAIIQVFAAEGRAAVLIMRRPSGAHTIEPVEPTLVPLTEEASASISSLIDGNSAKARESWRASYRRYAGAESDAEVAAWSDCIRDCLDLVGHHVMRPIDRALRSLGMSAGSEVVMSLPGALSVLPVLSAPVEGETRFCDRWSASLTPSIAMLGSILSSHVPHTMLAISDPLDARAFLAPLPLASGEAAQICGRFPPARCRHLRQGDTTVEIVLDLLPTSSLVHVACHGVYDWEQPNQSGIELARGRRLSVAQIGSSPGSMQKTRLVFLSACETGIAGQTSTPDQFLGVLPAFLHCGVRATVGTLWPVFDDAAMILACRFYDEFLDAEGHERCPPATALARSQSWLRDARIDDINREFPELSAYVTELASRVCRMTRRHTAAVTAAPQRSETSVRGERLFADPINWAGFVVLGR